MNDLWEATLNSSSPRYDKWRTILDSDRVPLLTPMAITAVLGGEKDTVYLLDWQDMDEESSDRLVDYICSRFSEERQAVISELDRTGEFPIRTSDVIISYSVRAFL